jgi:colanic acid/amylovoran biosynthesis protein
MCREILASASLIGLREALAGSAILDELGIADDNVVVTGDDAIEIGFNRRKPSLGTELGINLRLAPYSGVQPEAVSRIRYVLQRIKEKLDVSYVPLPVALGENADAAAIRNLISSDEFPSDGGASIATPLELVEQVSRCRVVITGSYHAGVFALSQGIPVVGLAASPYYFAKFEGLATQFDGGCNIVDLRELDLENLLSEAVNKAWATSDDNRAILLADAQKQVGKSLQAYERVYALGLGARRDTR